MDAVCQSLDLIRQAKNIVVLTGAGISTAAGIADFRGSRGLYVTRRYDPETVFDIVHFRRHPEAFYEFARDFLNLLQTVEPTLTHRVLARLEKQGRLRRVITQNIDGLHQKAGSRNVYEVHGGFQTAGCLDCQRDFSLAEIRETVLRGDVPRCSCGGVIKPDVVFFGENVRHLSESFQAAREADLFLVIGSSCVVYPAASIPSYASAPVIVVNQGRVGSAIGNVAFHIEEDADNFFKKIDLAA